MNPESASILKAARDLGIKSLVAADSSIEYSFYGDLSAKELNLIVKKLLCNEITQRVISQDPKTLLIKGESKS